MRLKAYLDSVLSRFGYTVLITKDGRTRAAKAFVQPLRRRHRLYINERYIPAGYFDNRYLLYIGSPDHPLEDGMRVICSGEGYRVVTAEEYGAHNETVYIWAILMPENGGTEEYYDNINGQ